MRKILFSVLMTLLAMSMVSCYKDEPTVDSLKHESVQLWEGGPYWATTNLGAEIPSEAGYYFAWGYIWGYFFDGTYWTDGMDYITFDDLYFLDYLTHTYEDMAAAVWGDEWSVPSKTDFENLLENCDYEYVSQDGTEGIKFTGRGRGSYSGKSVFFPATGVATGSCLDLDGCCGNYWTSSLYDDDEAYIFGFGNESGKSTKLGSGIKIRLPGLDGGPITVGCAVRPIWDNLTGDDLTGDDPNPEL